MTTLLKDVARSFEGGARNEVPVIASDIIYEGAAVGVVAASGHARPLQAADAFAGFCEEKADNSAGSAADINVRTIESGKAKLTVSGATITDKGQPVYATDDNAFTMSPVGGVFIGYVHRFVSDGVVIVAFDALNFRDPYAEYSVREVISANKTLDAQDCGKLFVVDTDAVVITLPAIADGLAGCVIANGGSYGSVAINISPAAADMILAPDLAGVDNKDLINTKATAKRGDRVEIDLGDSDGYVVTSMVGTWTKEA